MLLNAYYIATEIYFKSDSNVNFHFIFHLYNEKTFQVGSLWLVFDYIISMAALTHQIFNNIIWSLL